MSEENEEKTDSSSFPGDTEFSEDTQMWGSITTPESSGADEDYALASLRPSQFADYIGQETVKDDLIIACAAAGQRDEPLDHMLIHGPPGLGKTSLAKIVARELGVGYRASSGPVIEKAGDLAAILNALEKDSILFIDEIHRLPRSVEEVLYSAMEDFQLDIIIGQGPSAKSIKIDLKPFTLIGATTRAGLLTSPLRDRFGIQYRLEFYSRDELKRIIERSARILEIAITEEAASEVGKRSRGTPRIANRLLKRIRDYAEQVGSGAIDIEIVNYALDKLEIDEKGLDRMDRMILKTIVDKFGGGPVGLETIAVSVAEDKGTIEDVYEPFLIQTGLLARTRRGREVTDLGLSHLMKDKNIEK